MTQRKLAEKLVDAILTTGRCAECICACPCDNKQHDKVFTVEKNTCIEGVRQWLMEQNKSKELKK